MIKFRLMFDKEKETAWLNQLAKEGYAMKSFFAGVYTFEECEPGKYEYQIDMVDKFGGVSDDYREFMNEAGIEIVQTWGFWVILRREASEEAFVLYTDIDSQIEHYTKIKRMFKGVAIFEIIILMVETAFVSRSDNGVVWGCIILLTIITFAILRALMNTCHILEELKERKSGIPSAARNQRYSPILSAGLLINCAALLAKDSVSSHLILPIQILAIILMMLGICHTGLILQKTKDEK